MIKLERELRKLESIKKKQFGRISQKQYYFVRDLYLEYEGPRKQEYFNRCCAQISKIDFHL